MLGEHDIKVQIPYIIDSTTHVVSSKRNVPKGLQALINGKSIVKDSFVDAVVAVVTPRDGHHSVGHGLTPLEEDFDGNWPNANRYLPEPGNEPIPRPAELFIPNAERIHIFNGYTFIFVDRSQYENLGDALTNGGAKTKLFELELGRTTVAEVAAFVKETAGEEGTGELETAGQGKGVVFVRFRGKGDTEQWALAFLHDIDAALGQRSVEQNEFLDAILYNDASTLRRPLLDAETDDVTAQPSNASEFVCTLYMNATDNGDVARSRGRLSSTTAKSPSIRESRPRRKWSSPRCSEISRCTGKYDNTASFAVTFAENTGTKSFSRL